MSRRNHRTAQPSLRVGTRPRRGWLFPLTRRTTARRVFKNYPPPKKIWSPDFFLLTVHEIRSSHLRRKSVSQRERTPTRAVCWCAAPPAGGKRVHTGTAGQMFTSSGTVAGVHLKTRMKSVGCSELDQIVICHGLKHCLLAKGRK